MKNKFKKGNQLWKLRKTEGGYKNKGKIPWNKDLTKETDERVMKYVKKQIGQKRNIPPLTMNQRKRQKIAIHIFNTTNNPMWRPEVRKKVSEANKGNIPWNKGYGDYIKGDKHPNWQDGKSFEEYGEDWIKELKQQIRERDNFTCQKCNKNYKELFNNNKIDSIIVHHIDYNKKNCNPDNLICMCRSCHIKLHWTNRRNH